MVVFSVVKSCSMVVNLAQMKLGTMLHTLPQTLQMKLWTLLHTLSQTLTSLPLVTFDDFLEGSFGLFFYPWTIVQTPATTWEHSLTQSTRTQRLQKEVKNQDTDVSITGQQCNISKN